MDSFWSCMMGTLNYSQQIFVGLNNVFQAQMWCNELVTMSHIQCLLLSFHAALTWVTSFVIWVNIHHNSHK